MGKPKNCGKILRRLTCQRPLLKIAIVGRRGGIPAGKPTSRTLGRFLRWYAFTAGGVAAEAFRFIFAPSGLAGAENAAGSCVAEHRERLLP